MISVCMASYNGGRFIKEQIESILMQLSEGDELIISDDVSSDNTAEIIKGIKDNRIRLLSHTPTGYYTSNFENALSHAKGDYIFLSDQDDIWVYDKVAVCMKYLMNYDFVMTNASIIDEDENVIEPSRNQLYGVKSGFFRNFIKSRYLGCCFAFKRAVLDYSLPFPRNHDLCHHDSWISLIAEMNYKCIVIDKPLIMYRRHSANTSNGGETSSRFSKTFRIRLYLLYWLLYRKVERVCSK